jgi:hypothetical protein
VYVGAEACTKKSGKVGNVVVVVLGVKVGAVMEYECGKEVVVYEGEVNVGAVME